MNKPRGMLTPEALRAMVASGEIETVVAIWGRKQEQVPSVGLERDGVTLVRGRHLKSWLRGRADGPASLGASTAQGILKKLEQFRSRVRPG
jgi:hypothetical protein